MAFTHMDEAGNARMADVSAKPSVARKAVAHAKIMLQPATIQQLQDGQMKKGDVLTVAKIAAIMSVKRTPDLIPLCHTVNIEHVDVQFQFTADGIAIESAVSANDKTGVEMEALSAVAIAALTIYDMCKAVDKKMRITDIYLIEKSKG